MMVVREQSSTSDAKAGKRGDEFISGLKHVVIFGRPLMPTMDLRDQGADSNGQSCDDPSLIQLERRSGFLWGLRQVT